MAQYDDPTARYAGPQDPFDDPNQKRSNPLGLVGFILSLTCVLSPIGLILSIFGLFKNPKGFAIAGTVIGLLLTAILGVSAWAIWQATQMSSPAVFANLQVDNSIVEQQVERYQRETGSLPRSLDDVAIPPAIRSDPWGTDYRTESAGQGMWDFVSAGPDRQFGTADDFEVRALMRTGQFDPARAEKANAWDEAGRAGSKPIETMFASFTVMEEARQWIQQNAPNSAVLNPPPGGAQPAPASDPDADPAPDAGN